MENLLEQVAKELRPRFTEVVGHIDRFCDEYLNDEFKALGRAMAAVVCQKGSPVTRGKAAGWAAGIVSAVGWVNFLGDPSQQPSMTQEEIARGMGVSPATLASKTKVIRDGLRLRRFDPEWTVPSRMEQNPYIWMVQDSNGLIWDLRTAPRHVQEEAYRKGLIPFIPGEVDDATNDENQA